MKKKVLGILLCICMTVMIMPAASALSGITVEKATCYPSGALQSITAGFSWSGASASGRLVLMTEKLRSSETDDYGMVTDFGDFTDFGRYGSSFSSFDAVLAYDTTNNTFGIVEYGLEYALSSGSHSLLITFSETDIPLNQNKTYYVYLWTYYQSHYYPDALICAVQVKDGAVKYAVANGDVTRNSYDESTFTNVASQTAAEKNISLGYTALSDADTVNAKWDFVYFGAYNGSPIKWRVLSTKGNSTTTGDMLGTELNSNKGTPVTDTAAYKTADNQAYTGAALFMLSENTLFSTKFCETADNNNWLTSNLRSEMQSKIFPSDSEELKYVLKTTKKDTAEKISTDMYIIPFAESQLSEDTLFAPSARETEQYLGSSYDNKKSGDAAAWWLRSPRSVASLVGYIMSSGEPLDTEVNTSEKVRPALNLNLSSVLFTSAATNGKSKSALSANGNNTTGEYKLTMKDSARGAFTASTTAVSGNSLTVSYTNAKTGANEYISAMIVNADKKVTYYGTLRNAESESGTATLDLTGITLADTDEIYIFNEQINDDKKTDFSSELRKITRSVAPSVTPGEKKTPTANDFTFAAPSSVSYNGNAKTATVTSKGNGMGTVTVKYYDASGALLTEAPTNVGTYTVKIDVTEGENYLAATDLTDSSWKFTITQISNLSSGGIETTRYKVSFETNGGSKITTQTIVKGSVAFRPANPKKEAYLFDGWYSDKELTEEYDFSARVTKNITLYAKWAEDEAQEPSDENRNEEQKTEDENQNQNDNQNQAPSAEAWKNPFDDVKENDWFFEAVKAANESGQMSGVSENEFAPNENITRGMFVTVLYRAEGEPAVNKSIPFADVSADMYYANAVLWAAQNNIVNGVFETEFAPDENITREQMAAILYRYAQYRGVAPTGAWAIKLDYADAADISDYAVEGVMYCTMKNLMQGKGDHMFAPKDVATRAEIAAILFRTMQ